MKKSVSYNIRREFYAMHVQENMLAYKEEVWQDDQIVQTIEGLTTPEQFENVMGSVPIDEFKFQLPKTQGNVSLFKKEVREFVRNNTIGSSFAEIEKFTIKNPYSYLQECGFDDVEVLFLSWYDHNLYDLNGNVLPQAVLFEYINSRLDNGHYNIENALEILKQRTDIRWHGEPKIHKIPYYNASSTRNKSLEFTWIPSDEDFEKTKDPKLCRMTRYDFIIREIFGIPYEPILDEEDED